jgi:hypothetical protein
MAGSLRDAMEIFHLAQEAKVPVFSSSSLRYGKETQAVRNGSIGKVLHAETSSPSPLEKTHPDLFWYGVHGVESLFTVMGTGCESVKRGTTRDGRIEVIGTWRGGRTGIFREDPKTVFRTLKREFVPPEDRGWFLSFIIAPEGSSLAYTDGYQRQAEAILAKTKGINSYFSVVNIGDGVSRGIIFTPLDDWSKRDEAGKTPDLQGEDYGTLQVSGCVGGGTYRECMRAQGWPLRDACLDTRHRWGSPECYLR